jgi:hypothetical protein
MRFTTRFSGGYFFTNERLFEVMFVNRLIFLRIFV